MLDKPSEASRGADVVVIGGAVMDVKAVTAATAELHTSNPAVIGTSPGGVGRNIAEGLARLGRRTTLIAAIGDDEFGRSVLRRTSEAGVNIENVVRSDYPTGTYLATLDRSGELVIGAADMRATDKLTVQDVSASRDIVRAASFVVIDGNVSAAIARWALAEARSAAVPVLLEPVSASKAARMAALLDGELDTVTPDLAELAALVGHPVPDTDAALRAAARELHDTGVRRVWIRRGQRGSVLSEDGEAAVLAAIPTDVVDVTGAGDAMNAAYVDALLSGKSAWEAARLGHAAAALTIAHHDTVRADITPAALRAVLTKTPQGAPND